MYYYVKNIQGDIIKIVSSTGAVVANYAYNVWGELLTVKDGFGNPITDQTSIAYLNPLRYRGYVYDDETGLYYLQSRYYDPVTCRFINADIYCDTLSGNPFSSNMFAYCENTPLYKIDKYGMDAVWIQSLKSIHQLVGHSSLLFQDSSNFWWYFYWSGKSVQLLFLGNGVSLAGLNRTIERILSLFNSHWYYNYNRRFNGTKWVAPIDHDDNYNSKIHFKGDFSGLLDIAKGIIANLGDYRSMRINPNISEIDYRWYWYYPYTINGDPVHKYYAARYRPYSMVIRFNYKNPLYNLTSNNCMNMTARLLCSGRFSRDDYYFKRVLNIFTEYSDPNNAYYTLQIFNHASNHNEAYNCYVAIKMFSYILTTGKIAELRNFLSSTVGLFAN